MPKPTPRHQAPDRASLAIDQACEADRIYFERRPTKNFYVRNIRPGEFWPFGVPKNALVRVEKLDSQRRSRTLLDDRGRRMLVVVDGPPSKVKGAI